MSKRGDDKRSRLTAAAANIVHRQGFRQTSLADIADEAGIPPGNVYYYFKTKEAIGESLIGEYGRAQSVIRQRWNDLPDPRARLAAFVELTITDREVLAEHGCPIGTLNAELHKDGGPLARQAADIFATMLSWLEEQFQALGHAEAAPGFALHLLSALQGASLLAHSFGDPDLAVREAERLKAWIQDL